MTKRVIVDTNVLVSAALRKHSIPRKVVSLVLKQHILVFSEATIIELEEVFQRPKLNPYSLLEDRILFLQSLLEKSVIIQTTSILTDCPDPSDNRFLELAVDGDADCIISGDMDLLRMNPYKGIAIISPTTFLEEQ